MMGIYIEEYNKIRQTFSEIKKLEVQSIQKLIYIYII